MKKSTSLLLALACFAVALLCLVVLVRGQVVVEGEASVVKSGRGVKYYLDREYAFLDVPPGGYLFRTRNDNKTRDTRLLVRVDEPGTIFVLYDSRAERLPAWLDGYVPAGQVRVSDVGMGMFRVYARAVPAGVHAFGANLAPPAAGANAMYCVIFQPEAWQERRFDWRTEVSAWELRFYECDSLPASVEVEKGETLEITWEAPVERREQAPVPPLGRRRRLAAVVTTDATGADYTVQLPVGWYEVTAVVRDKYGMESQESVGVGIRVVAQRLVPPERARVVRIRVR